MTEAASYLFVYGTLLDKGNSFGAYLNSRCPFYAEGKFRGRLYHIGEYPGAVPDEHACSYVFGKIVALNHAADILKLLDEYEGFGPEEAQPNLFIRKLISVEIAGGTIESWVYLYNLPVHGLKVIPSGRYSG